MKRLFPLFLLLASLICYLEWGGGNSGYLFRMEYDVFFNNTDKSSMVHPFILLPLIGQLLLLISLWMPNRKLILAGILLLSLLVVMILLVGILSLNVKIILSTLPFIALSVFFLVAFKNK